MILDSLRHWVQKCHVDGFRFDLASVFNRRADGPCRADDSPMVSAIRSDPVLGNVRLIAEPWDAADCISWARRSPANAGSSGTAGSATRCGGSSAVIRDWLPG